MSHAILNPSSSHRWLHCPGSVPAVAALPTQEDAGEFADEGTAAHQLAAWCLKEGRDAASYIGQFVPVLNDDGSMRRTFKVDDDMASFVQVYVDSVRDSLPDDGTLLVECRVFSGVVSTLYGSVDGTADAIIFRPKDQQLEIHDLKFGRGVRVDAPDNPQLRIYALGALRYAEMLGLDVKRIRTVIHQPRLDHYSDEPLTRKELVSWGAMLNQAVERIDAGDDSLVPHEEACRWCPIKAACPALAKFTMDSVFSEFKDVPDLTDWGLGRAMDKLELVEQWCKSVRDAARSELDAGRPVDGWKLVEGRAGNREWNDEKQATEALELALGDDAYNRKILSPAQAEKKLKKNPSVWGVLLQLVTRKPSALQMVKDTDPRPAAASVLEAFK